MSVTRRSDLAVVIAAASIVAVGCGADAKDSASGVSIAAPSSVSAASADTGCVVPDGVPADGSVEGVRGEALVELLSGVDEEAVRAEDEGAVIEFDDPNYGGVWGDRQGGWVVAVVDCSPVDLERVAALAGGSNAVRVIEVDHSFEEVNDFRDQLWDEVQRAGVLADVGIDSTLDGRLIRVVLENPSLLPVDFGSAVPPAAFVIEAGEIATNADG